MDSSPGPVAPTTPPEETVPAAADWSAAYQSVESGVIRILATTCDGDGIGTGFLLTPRVLATAAHVVDGAEAVGVDGPDGIQAAHVLAISETTDLAILKLSRPVAGHTFSFAQDDAAPGDPVAAIGFPLNEPKTLTVGAVSGVDRRITVDGVSRSGLLQTDTALNPGNSGGPLVTPNGEVVGVVDALLQNSQGIGYAVQGSVAQPVLLRRATMSAPPMPDCSVSEAPEQLAVTPRLVPSPDETSLQMQETLSAYYNAINGGDYDAAIAQFAPSFADGFDPVEMARNLATSFDYDVVIHGATPTSDGARGWVTFVSVQAPRRGPDGEGCTEWSLDYDFVARDNRLLIDGVDPHDGDGHSVC